MAIPTNDSLLANWSTNANARLTAAPATYGTTAAVAAQYATVHNAFMTAYDNVVAARSSGNRSEALTETKNIAKQALLSFARPLYKTIQANTGVTAAAKIELGVVVPDPTPTPQPVPGFAPGLTVESVDGRLFNLRLSDPANPTRRRIPDGVNGAIVMSYVGETAPADPSLFKMEGPTSRTSVQVLFPETLAPGTQVWLTAVWFNERKQLGPACTPVSGVINYGGTMPMAA